MKKHIINDEPTNMSFFIECPFNTITIIILYMLCNCHSGREEQAMAGQMRASIIENILSSYQAAELSLYFLALSTVNLLDQSNKTASSLPALL